MFCRTSTASARLALGDYLVVILDALCYQREIVLNGIAISMRG